MGIGVFISLDAQTSKSGFEINPRCNCLTFVSHCNGNQMEELNGTIEITCTYSNGDPNTFDYPISNGEVCFRDGALNDCREGAVSICLDDQNYEICSVDKDICEVTIFGTLDNNPTINGQLIGIYNGIPTSAIVACQGPTVLALNNRFSAMELLSCPGDNFILNNTGYAASVASGECLRITVRNEDGQFVDGMTIRPGQVNSNGSIEIDAAFDDVGLGLYFVEFEIVCCNSMDTNCGPQDKKTAWINIQGDFGYDILGVIPAIFPNPTSNFVLGGSPNGTIYSDVAGSPFFVNLSNIENTENSDVTIEIFDLQCHLTNAQPFSLGTQLVSNPQDPIASGQIQYDNGQDCICLKIDISYDSGCTNGIVTDEYFVQSGGTCTNFTNPNDALQFRSGNINSSKVKLLQNPISNKGQIIISDMDLDQPYQLIIFDNQGRAVSHEEGAFLDQNLEFDINTNSGMYFYRLQIGEEEFQGKIIKQ